MRTVPIMCLVALSTVSRAQESISLHQAIQSAQSNRPAFRSARLRVEEARHSRRGLAAFPTTRLSLGYTSDRDTGGSDDDLVLAQPLDLFGRTSVSKKLGTARISKAEAGYRQVAGEIQSKVVNAYLDAASSTELARSAQAIQAVYERLHEAMRLRVEGGVAPGFHLTQVGLDLDQAKLRTEQRQTEAAAHLQRLAALIGRERQAEIAAGFPDLSVDDPDENQLARDRPDLLALAADVQEAEAEAGAAHLEGSPELELQVRRTPWQHRDDRVGLRVQLSIPLFDHGRSRSLSKAASTRADAAKRLLDDAKQVAFGELKAAKIELEAARAQIGKYEALVWRARELVEQLRPGLTEQATTLIEVLDATRVLRDLEQAQVESRSRYAHAQANYLQASGQLLEVQK